MQGPRDADTRLQEEVGHGLGRIVPAGEFEVEKANAGRAAQGIVKAAAKRFCSPDLASSQVLRAALMRVCACA